MLDTVLENTVRENASLLTVEANCAPQRAAQEIGRERLIPCHELKACKGRM